MRKLCQGYGKPKRGPYPQPMRARIDFKFNSDADREKALKRHAWYRKKRTGPEVHIGFDPPAFH
jgi:hypothetical protein